MKWPKQGSTGWGQHVQNLGIYHTVLCFLLQILSFFFSLGFTGILCVLHFVAGSGRFLVAVAFAGV